jgi:hypothetical protein
MDYSSKRSHRTELSFGLASRRDLKFASMPKGSEAASKCHAIIEVSEQQGIPRAHQTIAASFFS